MTNGLATTMGRTARPSFSKSQPAAMRTEEPTWPAAPWMETRRELMAMTQRTLGKTVVLRVSQTERRAARGSRPKVRTPSSVARVRGP
jgi:hypothetical protein